MTTPAPFYEPTEQEVRDHLPDVTCETCEETRNILDFYDNAHSVNMLRDPYEIVVDHGELNLQRDRINL